MKTVTIPTCANPFVVIVNGIKYTYPAGATMEVPDDVAEVIEQHEEAKTEPAPVAPPFVAVPSSGESGGGSGGVKVIDLSDEKYMGTYHTLGEGIINAAVAGSTNQNSSTVLQLSDYDGVADLVLADCDTEQEIFFKFSDPTIGYCLEMPSVTKIRAETVGLAELTFNCAVVLGTRIIDFSLCICKGGAIIMKKDIIVLAE